MLQNIKLKNAVAFNSNKIINNFIRDVFIPILDNLGVKDFAYQRYFSDGQYFLISNHEKMLKYYFFNIYDPGTLFGEEIKQTTLGKSRYCLWPQELLSNDPILSALYKFNMWNGFTIYQRFEKYVDAYYFSSTRENTQIHKFYINNLNQLNIFIDYFHKRSAELIDSIYSKNLGLFPKKIDLTYNEELLRCNFIENLLDKKYVKKCYIQTKNGIFFISK